MGYLPALGGKAAHLVSDLATVILNPVSERERQRHHASHLPEAAEGKDTLFGDEDSDKNSETPDGPDTSSFRAFLMSFVSSTTSIKDSVETIPEHNLDVEYPTLTPVGKASSVRKGLLSRGKHSIGRIISKAGLSNFRQKPTYSIDGEFTLPTARAAKESASAAMVCAKCKIPSPPRGPRFSPAGFGRFVVALGVPCRDLFFFLLIFP